MITIDTLLQSIISRFAICLAHILLFQCISHSSCDENVGIFQSTRSEI